VLGKARADAETALSTFSGRGAGNGGRKAEDGEAGQGGKR